MSQKAAFADPVEAAFFPERNCKALKAEKEGK
jgi:hypothetical protein